jgi:thiosulfate dehydrogenase
MRWLVLVGLVGGCAPKTALEYGQQLFHDPGVSTAASNDFTCATCHVTVANSALPYAGYTMHDVTARASWWGGFETTLLDSINQCVTNFMVGRELAATDDKARSLLVYLESLSPDPSAPPLPLTVVQNIVDVPSGDAAAGKTIYNETCGNCHGAPHTGLGRLTPRASVIPDETISVHGPDPTIGARPVTIEKVRHGKFFSIGGIMSLSSLEALSDAQLGDVLAYLEQFGLPPSPAGP